jgi:hypothetical protein
LSSLGGAKLFWLLALPEAVGGSDRRPPPKKRVVSRQLHRQA